MCAHDGVQAPAAGLASDAVEAPVDGLHPLVRALVASLPIFKRGVVRRVRHVTHAHTHTHTQIHGTTLTALAQAGAVSVQRNAAKSDESTTNITPATVSAPLKICPCHPARVPHGTHGTHARTARNASLNR